ncbi:MAG: hypothetical protein FWD65_05160, partial [Coriobacteriia bacterium]|nr:hypothetical protein [Coriobacteriia bacterium]
MRARKSSTPASSDAPTSSLRGAHSDSSLVIAREAAGRPRQTSPRQPISLRRRAVLLVLSAAMLLQMLAPMSTPQPASAVGTGNSHGTTLQTRVGTKSLNAYKSIAAPPSAYVDADKLGTYDNGIDFSCVNNQITKQNKMDTVYLQTLITWGPTEPTPTSAPTLTFDKPAGATFTLGGDTSTQGFVDSSQTRGDQGTTTAQITASTQITLTLRTAPTNGYSYNGLFNIDYFYTYAQLTTPDKLTTNVTPLLTIPGSTAAMGDSLTIKVACETDAYPGMTINTVSPPKLNGTNNNDGYTAFDDAIDENTSPAPTQLARVGSSFVYSLYPFVQTKLPNYPYSTLTTSNNGNIPQSATFTLTLPAEARLVGGTPPAGWSSSTVGGRTVLTTTTWPAGGSGLPAFATAATYIAQPSNTGTALQVYYTDAPANGTAYVYSAKVAGAWYDGTDFSAEKTTINHLYDDTIPSLNFTVNTVHLSSTFNNGGRINDGSYGLAAAYTNSYLALGDHENFFYSITNNLLKTPTQQPSEVPLTDMTVTIPFDGDLWNIVHLMNVTPDRYDTMTVTYKDGSTKTFTVGDTSAGPTLFDMVPGSLAAHLMRGTDPMSVLMAGKAATNYITQLSFHTAPGFTIPVGAQGQVLLAIEVELRTQRPDGTDIITTPAGQSTVAPGADVGKTSATVVANPPAGVTSDPMTLTVTKPSANLPIYATQEDRPIAWGGFNQSTSAIIGLPASMAPGDSCTITANSGFYNPGIAYNRRIPNPTLTLKLPESLSFDYSNAQLSLGSGPINSLLTNIPPVSASTRIIPPADYTVSVSTPGDGYSYYSFTYVGDTGSGSGNSGVLSYNDDYVISLTGVVTVADDAVAAAAVPLQVNTTTWAIKSGGVETPATAINSSVNIVTPTIMSTSLATQGDLVAGTWMKDTDGSAATPNSDDNLAKVNHSGVLRYQVINNASDTYSGDVYIKAPTGSLAPYLSLRSVDATVVKGASSSPASVIWYYSLSAPVTAGDLSTIPSASWVAFTSTNLANPTTLPSGITAFKLTGASTAPGDRLNISLNYDVTSGATSGLTARSIGQVKMGLFNDTSYYAGFKVVHSSYKVNYYKDSVAPANFIDSSAAIDADYGSEITLGTGTTNGLIGYLCPAGYTGGIQQDPVPYVMQDGDQTV